MLVEKKMSKTKQSVMIGLILATNISVGLILFKNFAPRKRAAVVLPATEPVPAQVSENLSVLESITDRPDQTVLSHPDFRALKKFGSWPVPVPDTGRPNPFLPVNK